MPTLPFTIDVELLRELGERLVGKPHIVLAELVKNSYDADATQVTIKFTPNEGRIEIIDDGHGMSVDEFKNFWMRIGTTHKKEKQSKKGRLMTGSKGVGRLAVQFLANKLTIVTIPADKNRNGLEVYIDWNKAIETKPAETKELTEVEVTYNEFDRNPSDTRNPQGTSIILEELKDEWTEDSIRDLASELWWLQPPFGSTFPLDDSKNQFRIRFQSTQTDYTKTFINQMRAIRSIWIARLVGTLTDGEVTLSLQFLGEQPTVHKYKIADFIHNNAEFSKIRNLNTSRFDIRIYKLSGRQKFGIRVDTAREYFRKYGGVHVYDGGFRLPYYGLPTGDWLQLEYDHSHRKNMSELFPKDIQVPRALNNLPTLGRIFGVVKVNTSKEPNLEIMITRDRLSETTAYKDLVKMVRYAIDWYANETARRKIEEKKQEASSEPTSLKFERVEQVLEAYESDIPKEVYKDIYNQVKEVTIAAKDEQELAFEQMSLLAPLATAGISALSYQHELKKQFAYIEDTINKIKVIKTMDSELLLNLNSLSKDLSIWLKRAKSTNLLFDYIADADNIQLRDKRLRAKKVIEEITYQTRFLARGTNIDYNGLDDQLFLPKASFAQWGAIFQNVFINAFTAMLDSPIRLLNISSRSQDKNREILIQDTGYGINLKNAEKFFDPFERESKISPERKALGYGGTGLGLTIVRLVADNIGCRVRFVEPQKGFKTAFSIQWREVK
jgi:signal transduction histidine kinase